MQLDHPVIHLFDAPVTSIAAAMPDAADPLWDRFGLRQKVFKAHQATRSIVFTWTDMAIGGKPVVMKPDYSGAALTEAVADYAAQIAARYPDGEIVRLMLAELAVGGEIKRHRDSGEMLTGVHRCHAAIETNPQVRFLIDDEPHSFPVGKAYEVDNTRPHAVINGGNTRRVHLICDIWPAQSIS
jgi:Aspartyl/Asparaginyl beta-hydroxylase